MVRPEVGHHGERSAFADRCRTGIGIGQCHLEQFLLVHGDGQQGAIGHPSQPGGATGDLGHDLCRTARSDAEDLSAVLVREPESVGAPTRALWEGQSVDDHLGCVHRLGSSSPGPAVIAVRTGLSVHGGRPYPPRPASARTRKITHLCYQRVLRDHTRYRRVLIDEACASSSRPGRTNHVVPFHIALCGGCFVHLSRIETLRRSGQQGLAASTGRRPDHRHGSRERLGSSWVL